MENRIKEIRKSHDMAQDALGALLGTTQQAISRMENSAYDISADLLVQMAKQFNVTTDYILGISDVKRDLNGQLRMNQEMDRYYDIVLRFQHLNSINQKTFRIVLERLEQAQMESVLLQTEKGENNAKDSNMR